MAFPSSSGSIPLTLEAAWQGARGLASGIKSQAQAMVSAAQSNVGGDRIAAYCASLAQANTQLSQYATVAGLATYAQQQVNNPSLDVAGAFSAMQNAVIATGSWIMSNFPKDGSGNILYVQFSGNGTLTYTQFTPAQLTGLVTQLNALIATID